MRNQVGEQTTKVKSGERQTFTGNNGTQAFAYLEQTLLNTT